MKQKRKDIRQPVFADRHPSNNKSALTSLTMGERTGILMAMANCHSASSLIQCPMQPLNLLHKQITLAEEGEGTSLVNVAGL